MSVQLDVKTGRMTGARVRRSLSLSVAAPRRPRARTNPGPRPPLSRAQLLDSSEDIGDIVEAYLASQDIRALVQEIRTRFGW